MFMSWRSRGRVGCLVLIAIAPLADTLGCATEIGSSDPQPAAGAEATGGRRSDDVSSAASTELEAPGVVAGNAASRADPEADGERRRGSGPFTVPCPCNTPGRLLRVLVLARLGDEVTLRVEELVDPVMKLTVGDEFEARFLDRLPCFSGSAEVVVGEEALAVLSEGRSAGRPADVRLTPWRTSLLMAKTTEAALWVPAAEVHRLRSDPGCYDTFGDWADLPGDATDGERSEQCVLDGIEQPCPAADPGQSP